MTSYKDSGVDIDAASVAVERARRRIEETHARAGVKVLSGIGGYSGIILHDDGTASGVSTDGTGAKTALAAFMDRLESIGIDLVAANVNDIAVTGLTPKLFVDYVGTGKIKPEKFAALIKGITDACIFSRVALIGGETAELPLLYSEDKYELVGTAVGYAASRERLILGDKITPGMKVYGFPSSGIHTNGFHLALRALGIDFSNADDARQKLGEFLPGSGAEDGFLLGDELLRPTVIYTRIIEHLRSKYFIAGMAHISGGGMVDNPPRILPDGCGMAIRDGVWAVPRIFSVIQERGNVPGEEMRRVFNRGIGLIAVSPDDLLASGEKCWLIGRVIASNEKKVFFI
ncbi:MAG: phosphoribosylformylglycinamidine cyclo-ligase [Parcubacteria group bacterium]|nr:phosphoribosylformylglycinamidine cyclo-ligase [Parcubacteria group bacterium]